MGKENQVSELSNPVKGTLITEEAAKLTREDLETVRNSIFKGCDDSELKLFLHDCNRLGVHPLDRLIHPTVRTNKKTGVRSYVPITSIDLFRSRAEDSGDYAGNDEPVFKGKPATNDFEASVTVYKIVQGVRCPFTATARWSEYKPVTDDWMWLRMPHGQLGKCAEALAIRKAFPRKLSKVYTDDEMAQAKEEDEGSGYTHRLQPQPKKEVVKDVPVKVGPAQSQAHAPVHNDDTPQPSSVGGGDESVNPEPAVMADHPQDAEQATFLKASSKQGVNKQTGKPWTMYGANLAIQSGETIWANTFDMSVGDVALHLQSGDEVMVSLVPGKEFNGKPTWNFTYLAKK